MAEQEGQGPRFEVHFSAAIAKKLRQLQRRAARQGRGQLAVAAIKHILQRLRHDPANFGEPLYRLTALTLQVRHCAVRPLVVNFAVHEERPVAFITDVWLLG